MTINPWDAAPTPHSGDATENITFVAVGRALTKWELFEQNMAWIFRACVTADNDPLALPASRAYGSAIAFQGRHSMVTAAADAFLGSARENWQSRNNTERVISINHLEKEFKKLTKESLKFAPRRNEIAHGCVRLWESPKGFGSNGYALFPSTYATNKHTILRGHPRHARTGLEWPDYIYTSAEIDAYAANFATLGDRAGDLVSHFIGESVHARLRP